VIRAGGGGEEQYSFPEEKWGQKGKSRGKEKNMGGYNHISNSHCDGGGQGPVGGRGERKGK